MRVLVTGATGFVGSHVVRGALERGHRVRALIRPSRAAEGLHLEDEDLARGDLTDPASLAGAIEGADAVIHCAALTPERRSDGALSRLVNVEGTANLLRAAGRSGRAPRWIQISSMSAHEDSTSAYGRTKLEADRLVRSSKLPWTILRPSIIYGPGTGGLVERTVALMRRLPILPIIGPGTQLIRPVYVEDAARAALDCLETPGSIGKSYMIGGADEVTFERFLLRLGHVHDLRRPVVDLPFGLAMALARGLELLSANPALSVDNVLGLKEARRVDISAARADLGFDPLGLDEGLSLTTGAR